MSDQQSGSCTFVQLLSYKEHISFTPEEVQSEEITQNNLDHYLIDEIDLR